MTLLQKLSTILQTEYAKHGEPPVRTIQEVTPEIAQQDLDCWGILLIKEPLTEEDWNEYFQLVSCELAEHLFETDDPFQNDEFTTEFEKFSNQYPNELLGLQMLRSYGKWWNSTNGFGNANFRFLYYQFLAADQVPTIPVGSVDLKLCRNPYHRVNLRLLAKEPGLWSLLKSFHSKKAMVSWDSVKVRIHHPKATKPALTKRHRDIHVYNGKQVDRKQAMLIYQQPGSISLGWVLFSHLPKVQQLLAQYFNKKPNGFSSVEDPELAKVIDKYWRCSGNNSFVVWQPETIHYEAEPTSDNKFKSFTQPSNTLQKISIRAVIGTHAVSDLSTLELYQLAYLSEHGFLPAIYNSANKGTKVTTNVVNGKSTQWRKPRTQTSMELQELQTARNGYKNHKTYTKGLPTIIKEMYGL